MADQLVETIEQGIATLALNRPETRNALSYELIHMLKDAVARLGEDPEVRVVVLTGAGMAFCAGGDIDDMTSRPAVGLDPDRFDMDVEWVRAGMESSRLLHEMPKPTLAIMPGTAAGAGLALALACDVRIVVRDAKLTTAFSKIALSSDFGAAYFLTQLVGPTRAAELLYFAEVITGEQAEAIGLVNRAVDRSEIDREGRKLAEALARLPPHALGLMKANLRAAQRLSLSECLDIEAANLVRTLGHHEFAEAIGRFIANR